MAGRNNIQKDYYSILLLSSRSSEAEIKKSFRRLAMQYHPDKNPDDPLAAIKFAEIQAAYETLSDRKKRAAYNYARYVQAPDQKKYTIDRPEDILQLTEKLAHETAMADPYRIDRDLLYFRLSDLLSPENIELLITVHDIPVNRKIVASVIRSAAMLPYSMANTIAVKLNSMAASDRFTESMIRGYTVKAKQQFYWNRYKIWVAVAAALLFCTIVYFTGR